MASLISVSFAVANAFGVGNFVNKFGVTLLMRSSVHCADKMTAMSSSNGFLWVRNVPVLGYSSLSLL